MQVPKGNILIVDDNETNIQVLANLLLAYDFELEYATSGKEALEWCADTAFDLILLDIMMPEMDGYEVCRLLKQMPNACEIPVIFITAKNDSESVNLGFNAGAVDYITKPFSAKELISRVSVHIGLRNSQKKTAELYHELKHKNDDILESYRSGKMLQKAVLPSESEMQGLFAEHFVLFRPCVGVGGDFYWVHRCGNGRTAIAVGDCTGHGIPGALMSMFTIAQLHSIVAEIGADSPAEILTDLRRRVIAQLHQSSDNASYSIDMAIAIIDKNDETVTFATANMPIIILSANDLNRDMQVSGRSRNIINAKRTDTLYYIDQGTTTTGYDSYATDYYDIAVRYAKGDSLVMFSDGYKDQFGTEENIKFSKQRFIDIMNNVSILPMNIQGFFLGKELDTWIGKDNDQTDDITVIGIELG